MVSCADGPTYRAVAERTSGGWSVGLDGLNGPQRFRARDLADIQPRALKLIGAYTGVDQDEVNVKVEVSLPAAIQDRLDIIRQHCADIEAEYDAVIEELVEIGLSVLDVGRVLRLHHRPPRPVIVSNAEVAEHGLSRHPDAVGLEWDDHGFAVTRKCRRHVEATRKEYCTLPPDGDNALIYEEAGFRCDFCDHSTEECADASKAAEAVCEGGDGW